MDQLAKEWLLELWGDSTHVRVVPGFNSFDDLRDEPIAHVWYTLLRLPRPKIFHVS